MVGPPGLMAGVHALIVDMNRLQQPGLESCLQDNNCINPTISTIMDLIGYLNDF